MPKKQQDQDEELLMRDILYRIQQVNVVPKSIKDSLIDFIVDGKVLGRVTREMRDHLVSISNGVFEVLHEKEHAQESSLTLSPVVAGTTVESRTQAVQSVMEMLRDEGSIAAWRNELYPIATHFYDEPTFYMERAAVPILGGLEYGVHVNGLVVDDDQQQNEALNLPHLPKPVKMWMARRSYQKSKYPGMLDHIVAGGQPAGIGLVENVVKECHEEAGIPHEMVTSGLVAAGAISYETFVEPKQNDKTFSFPGSMSRVVLYCFDLYLPNDFEPRVVDGEVDNFFVWNMDQIKESMKRDYHDPIKPNCYLVIIDYLMRAGQLSPETPGYLDVLRTLRSGDCR